MSLMQYLNKKIIFQKLEYLEDSKTVDFFKKNLFCSDSSKKLPPLQRNADDGQLFDNVMFSSGRSHLPLGLKFPQKEMLNEAKALKNFFVPHRDKFNHKWKSLCIHGASAEKTEDYNMYGYESRESANYNWTEIADKCPATVHWLKTQWPYEEFHRVRFMLLEPGGFIAPHNDTDGERGFHATNMALNQPLGCAMVLEDFGVIPWSAGKVALLDIGVNHSVVNLSNEDRYHIIIHGRYGRRLDDFKSLVLKSARQHKIIEA